jgi:hypothetical protein
MAEALALDQCAQGEDGLATRVTPTHPGTFQALARNR